MTHLVIFLLFSPVLFMLYLTSKAIWDEMHDEELKIAEDSMRKYEEHNEIY